MELRYGASLCEVIDGDTYRFDVSIDILEYDMVIQEVELRLEGVDTHETYGVEKSTAEYEKGVQEKNFVRDWFSIGEENNDSKHPFTIVVKDQKAEGKYGRVIGDVIRQCDGKRLSKALKSNYEGVGYDG